MFFIVGPEKFNWNQFKSNFSPPDHLIQRADPRVYHYSESKDYTNDQAKKIFYHYNFT